MSKKKLGPQPMLWPHPAVLVGTVFDARVDFATYAWAGVAASTPPAVAIAIQHHRHTLKGIHENRNFSVNIPSVDMVKETDYCGLVSGSDADKVKDCGFSIFYGNTGGAPMIEQCPINLECEVLHIINMGSHALVIGKVVEVHFTEECMTDGRPDIGKVRPFIFGPGKYHRIGEAFADAFSVGKEIKRGG
jgi:flavin reductase (DIM6/NTAB) family NADH-FMN oxidoreductase RutF